MHSSLELLCVAYYLHFFGSNLNVLIFTDVICANVCSVQHPQIHCLPQQNYKLFAVVQSWHGKPPKHLAASFLKL